MTTAAQTPCPNPVTASAVQTSLPAPVAAATTQTTVVFHSVATQSGGGRDRVCGADTTPGILTWESTARAAFIQTALASTAVLFEASQLHFAALATLRRAARDKDAVVQLLHHQALLSTNEAHDRARVTDLAHAHFGALTAASMRAIIGMVGRAAPALPVATAATQVTPPTRPVETQTLGGRTRDRAVGTSPDLSVEESTARAVLIQTAHASASSLVAGMHGELRFATRAMLKRTRREGDAALQLLRHQAEVGIAEAHGRARVAEVAQAALDTLVCARARSETESAGRAARSATAEATTTRQTLEASRASEAASRQEAVRLQRLHEDARRDASTVEARLKDEADYAARTAKRRITESEDAHQADVAQLTHRLRIAEASGSARPASLHVEHELAELRRLADEARTAAQREIADLRCQRDAAETDLRHKCDVAQNAHLAATRELADTRSRSQAVADDSLTKLTAVRRERDDLSQRLLEARSESDVMRRREASSAAGMTHSNADLTAANARVAKLAAEVTALETRQATAATRERELLTALANAEGRALAAQHEAAATAAHAARDRAHMGPDDLAGAQRAHHELRERVDDLARSTRRQLEEEQRSAERNVRCDLDAHTAVVRDALSAQQTHIAGTVAVAIQSVMASQPAHTPAGQVGFPREAIRASPPMTVWCSPPGIEGMPTPSVRLFTSPPGIAALAETAPSLRTASTTAVLATPTAGMSVAPAAAPHVTSRAPGPLIVLAAPADERPTPSARLFKTPSASSQRGPAVSFPTPDPPATALRTVARPIEPASALRPPADTVAHHRPAAQTPLPLATPATVCAKTAEHTRTCASDPGNGAARLCCGLGAYAYAQPPPCVRRAESA